MSDRSPTPEDRELRELDGLIDALIEGHATPATALVALQARIEGMAVKSRELAEGGGDLATMTNQLAKFALFAALYDDLKAQASGKDDAYVRAQESRAIYRAGIAKMKSAQESGDLDLLAQAVQDLRQVVWLVFG